MIHTEFLNIWFVIEHLLLTKAWFTPLEEWHPMTASCIMWNTKKSPFLRSPLRLKNSQQQPSICREIIAPKLTKQQFIFRRKEVNQNPYIYIYIQVQVSCDIPWVFFPRKEKKKRKAGSMYFFETKIMLLTSRTFWSSWPGHVVAYFFRKSSDFWYETVLSCGKKVVISK